MMRSIRIDDKVYQALREIQGPRESYGDVIEKTIIELAKHVPVPPGPAGEQLLRANYILVYSGAGKDDRA